MKSINFGISKKNLVILSFLLCITLSISFLISGCASKETTVPKLSTKPASELLLIPAEKTTIGEPVELTVIGYDDNGKQTSAIGHLEWSLNALIGTLEDNIFTPDVSKGAQAGSVSIKSGEMKAEARIRVIPPLPWNEDFENVEIDKVPTYWISATGKYFVKEKDGNKVLVKTPVQRGLDKSNVYIGPPTMNDYQIQVDVMGTRDKRRVPDMGLIANRYTLDMQGRQQRLQIRSWASDLRMAKTIPFSWETDVWYTMKMKVEINDNKALIYGKVWRTGDDEPDDWTIKTQDPLPNREGSPGIYAYSVSEIYYDNLKVW